MLGIKELNHVALHVKNVAESVDFYRNILGLEQLPRPAFDFDGAWFSLGGNKELHLLEGCNYETVSHSRANHFAVEVHSIREAEQHLKNKGVEMKDPKQRPDGCWQIFIYDPNGHCIELTELV